MSYSPNVAKLISGLPPVNEEPKKVGRLLQEAGKLTVAEASRVLQAQKTENLRFGEIALNLGLINEIDLQQALSQQFSIPGFAPDDAHFSADLVAAYQPVGSQIEQLRALRGQLMLRWFSNGHKALVISGIDAGDGASYLAANLAVVFSQLGVRTLLIDADLRRPRQHALFNLGDRPGLSDFLAGRSDSAVTARIPAFPQLTVLTAGAVPQNSAELLARPAAALQLGGMSKEYDVVLIDTAAAADGADGVMLAARTGGALLVLRQDHTRLAAAAAFQADLESSGAVLVGTVLNQH